jgi:hypothetical protein
MLAMDCCKASDFNPTSAAAKFITRSHVSVRWCLGWGGSMHFFYPYLDRTAGGNGRHPHA